MLRRIDTPDASLACELHGEGPLVVCLHGFPDCPQSFRHQLPALVAAGWRVALPTLRGYAPSGPARSGRYDPRALGTDVLAILEALSPHAPAAVVGHDWGAIAAYAAAALAPSRIRALATMAVPHLRVAAPRFLRPAQLRRSWYIGFFQLREIAERRLVANDGALIERLWRSWSPGYRPRAEELRAVKDAVLPHPRAVLSYYRQLVSGGRLLAERTLVPSLHLHGRDDGCVGVELAAGVERAYRGPIALHRIDGAGHFLHLERAAEVNRLLVEFLSRPETAQPAW